MQPGYQAQPPQQPIDNNMTMSIVAIFLFWPLAIPAIMAASKVNPLLQQGDFAGAAAARDESKKWSKIALIVGIVVYVIVCCGFGSLAVFGGLASSAANS